MSRWLGTAGGLVGRGRQPPCGRCAVGLPKGASGGPAAAWPQSNAAIAATAPATRAALRQADNVRAPVTGRR